MPSKDVIRNAQRKQLASEGTEVQSFESSAGHVVLDEEGLFRVRVGNHDVLWIPDTDRILQMRLMVCAHMHDAGHRGVAATVGRLREFCVWSGMETAVREFVKQCLHCADTRSGEVVPRSLGKTVHGTALNDERKKFCLRHG